MTPAGANRGVRMLEERCDDPRGNVRADLRGHAGSGSQAWALNNLVNDDPRHRLRSVAATDQGESVKRGGLLGYGVLYAEALEAAAERRERGHGTRQTPPTGFRRKGVTIRQRRPLDRNDQCVVVEGARRQTRPFGLGWSRAIRLAPGGIKKIELSLWHDILASARVGDAGGRPLVVHSVRSD